MWCSTPMSRGLLKTLWLAATAVFGSTTTSSRCLPKNIMRKNIIILNSILKQNILIVIQKHCRSTGSASWEWVRSWPPKLSQTAPSVPRLVSLICYSSLCLMIVIFILMDSIFVLVHLHLDGHLCYIWWPWIHHLYLDQLPHLGHHLYEKHGIFLGYWLYRQWS